MERLVGSNNKISSEGIKTSAEVLNKRAESKCVSVSSTKKKIEADEKLAKKQERFGTKTDAQKLN